MSNLIPVRKTIKRTDRRRQASVIRKNNHGNNKDEKKRADVFHKNGPGLNPDPKIYSTGAFSIFASRRAFHHSKNIGMTEMRMMAMMTTSKFFLTKGILPKK